MARSPSCYFYVLVTSSKMFSLLSQRSTISACWSLTLRESCFRHSPLAISKTASGDQPVCILSFSRLYHLATTETGPMGCIDSQGRLICLHLYDSLVKVMALQQDGSGRLVSDIFNVRLEELHLLDMAFLEGCTRPTLAIIYEDAKECRHLRVCSRRRSAKMSRLAHSLPSPPLSSLLLQSYEVDVARQELVLAPLSQTKIEKGSNIIIPLRHPQGRLPAAFSHC